LATSLRRGDLAVCDMIVNLNASDKQVIDQKKVLDKHFLHIFLCIKMYQKYVNFALTGRVLP
jgi:hypothetical protein